MGWVELVNDIERGAKQAIDELLWKLRGELFMGRVMKHLLIV